MNAVFPVDTMTNVKSLGSADGYFSVLFYQTWETLSESKVLGALPKRMHHN